MVLIFINKKWGEGGENLLEFASFFCVVNIYQLKLQTFMKDAKYSKIKKMVKL